MTWTRWERFLAGRDARDAGLPHDDCRVDEKQDLAKAMLQSLTKTCTEAQLRCLVIPFLREEDLRRSAGWRETLIEAETAQLEHLLLRPLLGDDETVLYGPDRHPTAHQNRIVATAIRGWVRELEILGLVPYPRFDSLKTRSTTLHSGRAASTESSSPVR